jgi:hypothetical protein
MLNPSKTAVDHLSQLVGMKLSMAYYAGNVRLFHFGVACGGECGRYAIHLQCPWRIETAVAVLTGLNDWYVPALSDEQADDWDPAKGGSLQEAVLRELMGDTVSSSRSIINRTDSLVVVGVDTDAFGGFRLNLSDGMRLSVFPCSSKGEQWRLLQPGTELGHFVVEF